MKIPFTNLTIRIIIFVCFLLTFSVCFSQSDTVDIEKFYENSTQLKYKGKKLNDEYVGTWTHWDTLGRITHISEYSNGKNTYKNFYTNGILKEIRSTQMCPMIRMTIDVASIHQTKDFLDMRDLLEYDSSFCTCGQYVRYDSLGQVLDSGGFFKGYEIELKEEDGDLNTYFISLRHGLWKYYENGVLKRKVMYDKGVVVF